MQNSARQGGPAVPVAVSGSPPAGPRRYNARGARRERDRRRRASQFPSSRLALSRASVIVRCRGALVEVVSKP